MNIVKSFNFEEHEVVVRKRGDVVWFRGLSVAKSLGYKNPKNAITRHVSSSEILRVPETGTAKRGAHYVRYVNEPGLYRLIFSSKLESAEKFKDWVFNSVLPEVRKTGSYSLPIGNQLKIYSENDLHAEVVKFIREYYPEAIINVSLGELQDTKWKRISSWRKGYQRGSPDITIENCHLRHNGLAIEFKTPKLCGIVSDAQKKMLEKYSNKGYKTAVCDDYKECIHMITKYFMDVRVQCEKCGSKFKSIKTLNNHRKPSSS